MTTPTTTPTASHYSSAHVDPAAQVADAGFVPVQTRSERPSSFEPADFGAPTGREVNWKHTPIAQLGGLFSDEPGDADAVTYGLDAVEAFLEPAVSEDGPYGGVLPSGGPPECTGLEARPSWSAHPAAG